MKLPVQVLSFNILAGLCALWACTVEQSIINLSPEAAAVEIKAGKYAGTYADAFGGGEVTLVGNHRMELGPWKYLIFNK